LEIPNIHVLRTYEDALSIKKDCSQTGKAFVIGGGVLGLETAFAIAESGCKVSVSDISEYPLPRQLDKEGGLFFKQLMEQKGIHIYCAEPPEMYHNDIDGACVIAAAGVRASLDLATTCGLKTNRGILVDQTMKTSVDDIYACGDVAEFSGVMPGLITIAAEQGKIAGQNAAGIKTFYNPVLPSPTIKVAGVTVLSVGSMELTDGTKIYRTNNNENYSAAIVSNGKLTGAAFIGDISPGLKFKKLMETSPQIGYVSSFSDIYKLCMDL
jgi:nitrite reductase (NADH) large subunit